MPDALPPRVVVPYADFLERRDRRRRIVSELGQRAADDAIDVGEAPAAGALTLPDDRPDQGHGK